MMVGSRLILFYFRMSQGQFDCQSDLLSIIGPCITKMTSNYRENNCPVEWLSICLWFVLMPTLYFGFKPNLLFI